MCFQDSRSTAFSFVWSLETW